MVTVFVLVSRRHSYPDTFGYAQQFQAIVRAWRPRLTAE